MKVPPVADILLFIIMGLPLIALIVSAALALLAGNIALFARMLPVSIIDTVVLMGAVGLVTATLGLGAAWLVAHFDFPLRRFFDWALILPLAVPTYLSAYAWVEFLDFTGPVQGAVRQITGASTSRDYWFPEIRSRWAAVPCATSSVVTSSTRPH